MRNKLLTILMVMFCDEGFRDHVETEFHCFYSAIRDIYNDADGDWDEIIDEVLEVASSYIKVVYDELEGWY